jgi:hypothetical protein
MVNSTSSVGTADQWDPVQAVIRSDGSLACPARSLAWLVPASPAGLDDKLSGVGQLNLLLNIHL